jgi:hypothetical protein
MERRQNEKTPCGMGKLKADGWGGWVGGFSMHRGAQQTGDDEQAQHSNQSHQDMFNFVRVCIT